MALVDGASQLLFKEQLGGSILHLRHCDKSEWIEYRFDTPVTCSRCGVFWVVDANEPGCRLPESWAVKNLVGDEWKDVSTSDNFATQPDRINEVQFQPIQTKALRLEVQLQKNFSAGVFEWFVSP